MESLRTPGRPTEQFLEVIAFRRADGREVPLRALPLAQLLGKGETLRVEEVELAVPDGRSARSAILLPRAPRHRLPPQDVTGSYESPDCHGWNCAPPAVALE